MLTGEAPYGRCEDILLEGQAMLSRQLAPLTWPTAVAPAAQEAVEALLQVACGQRASGAALRAGPLLASVDWRRLGDAEAPGPKAARLGATVASARAEPYRPRRGAALQPVTGDAFDDF